MGTYYPTELKDTNGNKVNRAYEAAPGAATDNSSS